MSTRGASTADDWNDTIDELVADAATLRTGWNKLVTIVSTLPNGELDTGVNVFQNGLDGRTLYVDSSLTSTSSDLRYFNSTSGRPSTVQEALDDVYDEITSQVSQSTTDILAEVAIGLPTAQKNAIGANIFDSADTSSEDSLDGKSENNRLNLIQLATDLYGAGYTLDKDGAANLTNNSVQAMVDALLELHNGNWDDDVALNHAGALSPDQDEVGTSHPGDDTYTGAPSNLEEDLDRLRNRVQVYAGTTTWLTSATALYTGGPNTLEGLLTTVSGAVGRTAVNPWGYDYTSVDGVEARFDAIRDFTGQTTHLDATTTYSGNYITDGHGLEQAIHELDEAVLTISGITAASNFLGLTDTASTFSGEAGRVPRVDSLETQLEFDDKLELDTANVVVTSGAGMQLAGGDLTVTAGDIGVTDGDVEVVASGTGFILPSADGTRWRITVGNDGALTTTAL
jgi:hypothetical protein